MKISDESKIGIFAVFTLVILILGFNLLKGRNVLHSSNTYYAYYENINGLQESNPVVIRGFRIGKVYNIEFDQEKGKIKVSFSIKSEIEIPEGSVAKIIDLDILGAKAIEIIPSGNKKIARNRSTLKGETAITLSQAVDNVVNPVVEKLNKSLNELNKILENDGSDNLKAIIENLKNTTENLSESTEQFNRTHSIKRLSEIIKNVESISMTLKNNEDNINHFIQNFSAISDSIEAAKLGELISESKATISRVNSIAEKINHGEGSLGLLVNNDSLYSNLENASKNLNKLLADIQKHPSRYVQFSVFGKKEKQKTEDKKEHGN